MPVVSNTMTETEQPPVPDAGVPGAQLALRETEQLLDTLPTILVGLTEDLRVTRWNRMAGKIFGGTAAQTRGKRLEDAGIRWDWDRVRRGISACREEGVSIRVDDVAFVRTNGKDGLLGLTIQPLTRDADVFWGFTIIGADITERKNLENQLTQAQKLRSIGQLASGIAHEINTPVQYVGDNTRFLQDAFADLMDVLTQQAGLLRAARSGSVSPEAIRAVDESIRRADLDYLTHEIPLAIGHTLEGIDRIAKIVRAMKEFAHPGREDKVPADLNKIVETTLDGGAQRVEVRGGPGDRLRPRPAGGVLSPGRDQPGDPEPHRQRGPRHRGPRQTGPDAQRGHHRRYTPQRRLGRDSDQRHRRRHSGGDPAPHFRSLFHDQGTRPRHRTGPGHLPPGDRGQTRRPNFFRIGDGAGDHFHHQPSPR